MTHKRQARLHCRALRFLDPVAGFSDPTDLDVQFRAAIKAPVPLCANLETRSDTSFLDHLAEKLAAEGLADDSARFAALMACTQPTRAVVTRAGSDLVVHQAVIVEPRQHDELTSAVQVEITVEIGRPPRATLKSVDVEFVDLENDEDVARLIRQTEDCYLEHAEALHSQPHSSADLAEWAWLGDPSHVGVQQVPADWERRVTALGFVYGATPTILTRAEQAKARRIADRASFALAPTGISWLQQASESGEVELPIERIGAAGGTFDDLMTEARLRLLEHATEVPDNPFEPREIGPEEVVYHRKVGNSRKYDNFDAGSTSPCQHGAGAFRVWTGDKCTKGMARRYTNFEPSMLIHCRKHPNCNVYGIDGSRGGASSPS